jgi:hypothetical protein
VVRVEHGRKVTSNNSDQKRGKRKQEEDSDEDSDPNYDEPHQATGSSDEDNSDHSV